MSEPVKKTVQIDLEVDTTQTDSSKNKFQWLIDLAKAVDAWRVFPRLFISVYIYLLWAVVIWFMTLDAPTVEQAGLISVITGVGAAWFASYVGSKKK